MEQTNNKKEKFKLIPSVYALLIENEKILLLRRFNTGYEDGNYGLVAGHADGEETMREAMIREGMEEAGIKIDNKDLDLFLTMHRWCGDHERIDLFFVVEKWQGEIQNKEPNKCDDLAWVSFNNLPVNIIPYIKAAIFCYLKGIRYCEFNWPRKNKIMQEVKIGKYQNWRGNFYEVIGVGKDTETMTDVVIYKSLYKAPDFSLGSIWVRPKEIFLGEKEINGKKVPRFKFIG